MGFFSSDTEEEKQFKVLIKAIKSSNKLDVEMIQFLVNYLEDVRSKRRNNDFYEYDFLEKILLELVDSEFSYVEDFKSHFEVLVDTVKFLLPEGLSSNDYQSIKNMIVNNLVGVDGLIEKGLFDKNLYSIFGSRHDYMFVMNLLADIDDMPCSYQDVFNYICEVAPWAPNQDVLRNEAVSCINSLFLFADH